MNPTDQLQRLLNQTAQTLLPACESLENATREAWWLLEAVTHKSKASLLATETTLTDTQQATLNELVRRRVENNEPLQYLIGTVEFCGITLSVKPPTFIPRPETEEWCHWLINRLSAHTNASLTILDLCTGSGAIGLALAHHLPHASVTLVDKESHAVALAQQNAEKNNLSRVRILQGDLFQPILNETASFDLIVSNPPYVSKQEWAAMDATITSWEHEVAFVANDDGLAIYRELIQNAPAYLSSSSILGEDSSPRLVLELGAGQASGVAKMLTESDFSTIEYHKDLCGAVRCISATL